MMQSWLVVLAQIAIKAALKTLIRVVALATSPLARVAVAAIELEYTNCHGRLVPLFERDHQCHHSQVLHTS